MTVKHVWMAFVLGAVAAACSKDTGGTLTNPTPVAGLRYFNAVSDTTPVDFRVVDIVGYAPNQVQAVFRTGGSPSGISTNFPPPYQAVEAGTRHLRVFLDDTTVAVASTILLDTTYTFAAGTNYTFYLYGYANSPAHGTPRLNALITVDSVPTIPAGSFAVRVINLAPGLGTVDAFVVPQGTGTLAGTPTVSGAAFLGVTPYANATTGTRLAAFTATGTTTPALFQANMTAGVTGSGTVNPIAGTLVAGTAMTMLVMPASVSSTGAPEAPKSKAITSITRVVDTAFVTTAAKHGLATNNRVMITGAAEAAYNGIWTITKVDSVTFYYTGVLGAPATPATGTIVWWPSSVAVASITLSGTTATVTTAANHGIATNDVVRISGADQPEYNGSFVVTVVGPTTFTYTVTGAPASPATGGITWWPNSQDYANPMVTFLIDVQPALTAP